jgi:hypothetical protein
VKILAGAGVIGCMVLIKTTSFFGLTDIMKSHASERNRVEVTHESFISDFSVPEPVLKKEQAPASSIHYRPVKRTSTTGLY